MFHMFRDVLRKAVPRWSGIRGRRLGLPSALILSVGLLALALQALAPALAQGRAQKNSATVDGFNESSLVQLLVTVDKARTVGCDQEFAEVLVANPMIADVIALSNKQVYVLGKKA